jgi:hypothetical protein
MADMGSSRNRRVGAGTQTGVLRRDREVQSHKKGRDGDGYNWALDVAGEITLGGLKLILANRAAVRIRSPFRLT